MHVHPKLVAIIIGLCCVLPSLGCDRAEQSNTALAAPISSRPPFDVQLKNDFENHRSELAKLQRQRDPSNPELINRISKIGRSAAAAGPRNAQPCGSRRDNPKVKQLLLLGPRSRLNQSSSK